MAAMVSERESNGAIVGEFAIRETASDTLVATLLLLTLITIRANIRA